MDDGSRCRSGAPSGRPEDRDYQVYRARYEQLRDDLMRRDRQVRNDPLARQRWPLERTVSADRVEQALAEWEVFGHKADVEARGRTVGPGPLPETGSAVDDCGVETPPVRKGD